MRVALWYTTKLFVFVLALWTIYEIEAIESGHIHAGRAKVAVLVIASTGIALAPTKPTAEWMGKKEDDD